MHLSPHSAQQASNIGYRLSAGTQPNTLKLSLKLFSMDKEEYLSTRSDHPLRVTCYGSSSSATPVEYLAEAEALGRTLALRGHTCVNGAGSAGCMAAMNDGASAEGGDIVGVIHEMFVVDGQDWGLTGPTETGGAHAAFHGGKRTILVASGNDLRERKRLLVENADALVVLPGGPGTFDEVRNGARLLALCVSCLCSQPLVIHFLLTVAS